MRRKPRSETTKRRPGRRQPHASGIADTRASAPPRRRGKSHPNGVSLAAADLVVGDGSAPRRNMAAGSGDADRGRAPTISDGQDAGRRQKWAAGAARNVERRADLYVDVVLCPDADALVAHSLVVEKPKLCRPLGRPPNRRGGIASSPDRGVA
jgi:hypothetical protein